MRIAIRVLSPHGAPHKWIHGDKHEEVLLLGLSDFFHYSQHQPLSGITALPLIWYSGSCNTMGY